MCEFTYLNNLHIIQSKQLGIFISFSYTTTEEKNIFLGMLKKNGKAFPAKNI